MQKELLFLRSFCNPPPFSQLYSLNYHYTKKIWISAMFNEGFKQNILHTISLSFSIMPSPIFLYKILHKTRDSEQSEMQLNFRSWHKSTFLKLLYYTRKRSVARVSRYQFVNKCRNYETPLAFPNTLKSLKKHKKITGRSLLRITVDKHVRFWQINNLLFFVVCFRAASNSAYTESNDRLNDEL